MINYFFELITEWKSILITNIMDIIKWHSSFYFIIRDSARDFTCRHTYVCRFCFIIILVWFCSLWCLLIPWGSKDRGEGGLEKNHKIRHTKEGVVMRYHVHIFLERAISTAKITNKDLATLMSVYMSLYISIVKLYFNSKKIFSKFQYTTFHKKYTWFWYMGLGVELNIKTYKKEGMLLKSY